MEKKKNDKIYLQRNCISYYINQEFYKCFKIATTILSFHFFSGKFPKNRLLSKILFFNLEFSKSEIPSNNKQMSKHPTMKSNII